jgi:hypothetical protein
MRLSTPRIFHVNKYLALIYEFTVYLEEVVCVFTTQKDNANTTLVVNT